MMGIRTDEGKKLLFWTVFLFSFLQTIPYPTAPVLFYLKDQVDNSCGWCGSPTFISLSNWPPLKGIFLFSVV